MRRIAVVADRPPADVALWVSAALIDHLYETALAIVLLLEHGFLDQAVPLLRLALSVTTNTIAIWRRADEADGVALQYLLFSQRVRHARLVSRGGRYGLDQALAERIEANELQIERELLDRLESERAISPIALGKRLDTWSGLSDRDLIALVWYEGEWLGRYSDMSNASHANVVGIWHRLVDRSRSGAEPTFTNLEVADLTVTLFETAAGRVATYLDADLSDDVSRAATAFWWSSRDQQDDFDLQWEMRPNKYDLEDEENPA